MMTCSIPDCANRAAAHGLCQKHYMRLRRHGDPGAVNKRGPKPAADAEAARMMLPESSPRTQARFACALRLDKDIREVFGEKMILLTASAAATRADGSRSVSLILDLVAK